MPRIRTVKPEFLRHEELQELEMAHPHLYPMLVFLGLWQAADKEGVFEWKPRHLHLDILPFIPFDLGETLGVLAAAGFIRRVSRDGKDYGVIPTFLEHQRINGKELNAPSRYGLSIGETPGKHPRTTREAPENHPGAQEKEKEKEKEKEGKGKRKKDVCSEPSAPSPQTRPLMLMPCVGGGPKEWPLHQQDVDAWKEAFPALDVMGECRKAAAWLDANPTRRKTHAGMKKFLVSWLGRAQDNHHPQGGNHGARAAAPHHRTEADERYLAQRGTGHHPAAPPAVEVRGL